MTYRFNLRIAALGLALLLLGGPAFAAASTAADAPASATATATASDDGRRAPAVPAVDRGHGYAQREAATPRAADFKGNGVGIYVGGSTLAVVLVIVLVVVLL